MTQATTYTAPHVTGASGELDAAVVDACRAGDPAALRAFVVRYQRVVFAFLSRTLGAGYPIEDLAQEIFLRAFRALPRFDSAGSARPSTWLLTIASRLVADERRRRRLPTRPLDDAGDVPGPDTPETERRRAALRQALARAASELPDVQRDVFVLVEFHGLDAREVGRVLGVPEATVKTRLFRARERLRASLDGILEET